MSGPQFSTGTDMKPALESVADLTNMHDSPQVEVSAWSCTAQHSRGLAIKTRSLYCHWIAEDAYQMVADPMDYSSAPSGLQKLIPTSRWPR
jgi:hypothetical protein